MSTIEPIIDVTVSVKVHIVIVSSWWVRRAGGQAITYGGDRGRRIIIPVGTDDLSNGPERISQYSPAPGIRPTRSREVSMIIFPASRAGSGPWKVRLGRNHRDGLSPSIWLSPIHWRPLEFHRVIVCPSTSYAASLLLQFAVSLSLFQQSSIIISQGWRVNAAHRVYTSIYICM